ncbi:MAG: hypothetical protein HYS24_02880 [Ignavibacteriales bacterium]|nr:hypothetical protein [Ignavibacteriales bacterium]MBK7979970.1 hypothetical protein [Ignavibacteriota bacterium]
METYFEPSISAYFLINEVSKKLSIDEIPEKSVMNGNAKKIISECVRIIETNYNEKRTRELLKYYVAHSFFEDYDLENEENFLDQVIN